MKIDVRRYFYNIGVALNQLANCMFLFGAPDETVSSRLGRWKDGAGHRRRAARVVCWLLGLIDPGHCDKAEQYERSIIHRPESINDKPGD
jgi:hypothetical protein